MKGENIIKTVVVCVDGKEGRTVASCLGSDGEVMRGRARCMEGDEFKVEIGAIIALCKALGVSPVKACYDVMDVYAKDGAREMEKVKVKETVARARARCKVVKSKSGEKNKTMLPVDPEDLKGMQVGRIKRGHALLVPTNKRIEYDYGVMGTPTKFFDKDGKALYVGDLVTVEARQGDVRTGRHWKAVPGLTFVVDERSDDPVSKGQYIMGMMSACNDKTGKIDKRFRVRKAKSWKEVEIGEVNSVGMVKVVWEDEV